MAQLRRSPAAHAVRASTSTSQPRSGSVRDAALAPCLLGPSPASRFVLPRLLAKAVHAIRPGVPVILTSGRAVTEQELAHLGAVEVLPKPWRVEEAARALARVLERARPGFTSRR